MMKHTASTVLSSNSKPPNNKHHQSLHQTIKPDVPANTEEITYKGRSVGGDRAKALMDRSLQMNWSWDGLQVKQ